VCNFSLQWQHLIPRLRSFVATTDPRTTVLFVATPIAETTKMDFRPLEETLTTTGDVAVAVHLLEVVGLMTDAAEAVVMTIAVSTVVVAAAMTVVAAMIAEGATTAEIVVAAGEELEVLTVEILETAAGLIEEGAVMTTLDSTQRRYHQLPAVVQDLACS
jgi:hypothetical protein